MRGRRPDRPRPRTGRWREPGRAGGRRRACRAPGGPGTPATARRVPGTRSRTAPPAARPARRGRPLTARERGPQVSTAQPAPPTRANTEGDSNQSRHDPGPEDGIGATFRKEISTRLRTFAEGAVPSVRHRDNERELVDHWSAAAQAYSTATCAPTPGSPTHARRLHAHAAERRRPAPRVRQVGRRRRVDGADVRGGSVDVEVFASYVAVDLAVLVAVERQHAEVGELPSEEWSLRNHPRVPAGGRGVRAGAPARRPAHAADRSGFLRRPRPVGHAEG